MGRAVEMIVVCAQVSAVEWSARSSLPTSNLVPFPLLSSHPVSMTPFLSHLPSPTSHFPSSISHLPSSISQMNEHHSFMYADLCRKITDNWSSGTVDDEEVRESDRKAGRMREENEEKRKRGKEEREREREQSIHSPIHPSSHLFIHHTHLIHSPINPFIYPPLPTSPALRTRWARPSA